MLGKGGPADYPHPEEVFNTQAGALNYYQVEVRRLRHDLHLAQDPNHAQQQLQQLIAVQRLQIQQLQQDAQNAQQDAQLIAQQHAQLAQKNQQNQQLAQQNAQLTQRATNAEGHRNSDLEKIKKLTRALTKEKQQAAREAQRAKLRSSGAPALAAAPAQPRTPAAREVRGLGVAVR
jgi:septal ring factor EnvC (AmiA/AmiB activator)